MLIFRGKNEKKISCLRKVNFDEKFYENNFISTQL